MNIKLYITVGILFLSLFTNAQEATNELNFSLLRQDDEISITEPKNIYHQLKSIPLGDNSTLSIGGSYRFQWESYTNEWFNKNEDQNDVSLLHRSMLHAHLKVGKSFELFGELNSSLIGDAKTIIPVEKDELNVNQFFAKYHFNEEWNILVGRQNMGLGSSRLVGVREGPNVRLSFDMTQIQYKEENTDIRGFYAIPVHQKYGVFDNNAFDLSETLSGIYWTQRWENTNTDIYALYKKEDNKTWNNGTGDDKRATIGIRHFGNWKGLKYNNEFAYQLGKFGNNSISAWTASLNIEKGFRIFIPFNLGLKTEVISGDISEKDNTLNTFDALYPRGAYFGRVAKFGPSNLIDFHPYIHSDLGKWSIEFDYAGFWRFSTNDGVYNPPLMLDFPSTNNERLIAHQIGSVLGYSVNKFIGLELESNIIFPGDFLKQRNEKDNLYHVVFTTEIKF